MAYISLYRKWRSQSFSQLVGQDHITRTLANSILTDTVAHAYLFAGPRGTGKTSTAKILAKAVNCLAGPTPEPCGNCDSCASVGSGSSLDVIEMDAASNRGIDEIRDLRDKVAFGTAGGRRKVYIIDEVHMLTEPAFNALLKTLEEPPSHVIFVLATTDPHKVPATISSRCQRFEFRRIATPALTSHLRKIAEAEKIAVTDEALALVAGQAEGSLRDAISILDQLAGYTEKNIQGESVRAFLGLVDSSLVESAVDLISSDEVDAVFEFVDSLVRNGRDLKQFIAVLLAHLRDLFVLAHVKEVERRRQLVNAADERIERMAAQGEVLGADRIRSVLTEVGRLYDKLRTSTEPRLELELTLIGLMRGRELSAESLAQRIARLEQGVGAQPPSGNRPPAPAARRVPPAPVQTKRVETAAPKKAAVKVDSGSLDIDQVLDRWSDVLSAAKTKKLSLAAFLIEGRPDTLDQRCLRIAFPSQSGFTCRELRKEPNAQPFRQALLEVLGVELTFETILTDEADMIPPQPEQVAVESENNEVLDLIKDSFGAQVVDD
jgi:DNA polymerase III subunit gamma/tau